MLHLVHQVRLEGARTWWDKTGRRGDERQSHAAHREAL
jgi:hypothetical protein